MCWRPSTAQRAAATTPLGGRGCGRRGAAHRPARRPAPAADQRAGQRPGGRQRVVSGLLAGCAWWERAAVVTASAAGRRGRDLAPSGSTPRPLLHPTPTPTPPQPFPATLPPSQRGAGHGRGAPSRLVVPRWPVCCGRPGRRPPPARLRAGGRLHLHRRGGGRGWVGVGGVSRGAAPAAPACRRPRGLALGRRAARLPTTHTHLLLTPTRSLSTQPSPRTSTATAAGAWSGSPSPATSATARSATRPSPTSALTTGPWSSPTPASPSRTCRSRSTASGSPPTTPPTTSGCGRASTRCAAGRRPTSPCRCA